MHQEIKCKTKHGEQKKITKQKKKKKKKKYKSKKIKKFHSARAHLLVHQIKNIVWDSEKYIQTAEPKIQIKRQSQKYTKKFKQQSQKNKQIQTKKKNDMMWSANQTKKTTNTCNKNNKNNKKGARGV